MKSFQFKLPTIVYIPRSAPYLLWLIILVAACAKDQDTQKPKIQILFPPELAVYSAIDTIPVLTSISDDEMLKYVTVELNSSDFTQVYDKRSFPLSGKFSEFSINYDIDEPFLNSGIYYLVIRAGDGSNESSEFREIYINAAPRVIEQFVVCTLSGNAANVLSSEDAQSWNQIYSSSQGLNGAALNYRQNVLALVEGEYGDADFYDLEEFELKQSYPGASIVGSDFFRQVKYDVKSEKFVILQGDSRLRIFDKEAEPNGIATLFSNYLPTDVWVVNTSYYVNEQSISTPQEVLNRYGGIGLLLNTYQLNGEARHISFKSPDEVFVWIHAAAGATLKVLQVDGGLLSTVFQREGETLQAIAELESGNFIFSTDQGLYRYSYLTGALSPLNEDLSPEKLFYDDVNSTIYGVVGSDLLTLSSSGSLLNSQSFNGDIVHFAIDYNK